MPLDTQSTLGLQNRFSVQQVDACGRAVKFQSVFDAQTFGTMGMFVHRNGQQLVWDQFYPFGQTHEEGFRSDLLGKGLGTLAHTQVLMAVSLVTGRVKDATVRVFGAEPGFQKILERAGVPECSAKEVSLEHCLRGSFESCDAIGFDTSYFRKQVELLLG